MKPEELGPRSVLTTRRTVVSGLAGWSALTATGLARAATEEFPNRPVRLTVAWPPGAATDTCGRLLGQKMGEALGQSFVIENKAGASGIIGADAVRRSPADGYTLLFNTSNHASNKIVFPQLPYDPIADFSPICQGYRNILVLAVHPSVPARNMDEFIKYARGKRGALNFGTSGRGTPHQLAGELLKLTAKIQMEHIPYKGGGPSLVDLMSGQIQVCVISLAAVLPAIRAGQVIALAITEKSRYEEIPDVPTIAETFPGFDVSGWGAMFAPAGTPKHIVGRLNQEAQRALRSPEIAKTMNAAGLVTSPSTPEELGNLVRGDIQRWTTVAKSGIKFT